jgi:hypothetical protein
MKYKLTIANVIQITYTYSTRRRSVAVAGWVLLVP